MSDDRPKPPDLQEWVQRYGGYWKIPWDKWDAAVAEYKRQLWIDIDPPLTMKRKPPRK